MDLSDYQGFGCFFRLCAALSSQEVNFSHLGRDIGVTPQTAHRWLDLMKGTFQWFELPPFTRNAVKRISGRPKGYIADSGTMCAALAVSSPNAVLSHPSFGAIMETAVVAELRKQCSSLAVPPKLHHWRTHAGAEVDIVLERDGVFFPIEIKASSRPTRGDCRGISAFRTTYPDLSIKTGLVISPVERAFPLSENAYAFPFAAV